MAGNSFGKIFRLTTFGESHNEAIGGVIDGCPAGVQLNLQEIQNQLDRRKPGQSPIVSQRKETDQVKFLSGIFQGKTTGTPIGFLIENTDPKSHDYSLILKTLFAQATPIILITANMGIMIIAVADEVQPVKRRVG